MRRCLAALRAAGVYYLESRQSWYIVVICRDEQVILIRRWGGARRKKKKALASVAGARVASVLGIRYVEIKTAGARIGYCKHFEA